MESLIQLTDVTKQFQIVKKSGFWRDLFAPKFTSVTAVDNVTFSIGRGESVAFLGPNGAGKTTTIKMLTGLIHPSSGTISVLGFEPFQRNKEFLRRIGLVMGNRAGLNWDLTPEQSFWLFKNIYRIEDLVFEKRLDSLLELLDIRHVLHTQVRKLSLGERMKFELAGSILHAPDVLFLDEPTIGLDVISKQNIRTFLREIQRTFNTTLLLTSHDMDDVERVCDRVIVINRGRIGHDGSLDGLVSRYQKTRIVEFVFEQQPPDSRSSVFELADEVEIDEQIVECRVDNQNMPKLIAAVTSAQALADIRIHFIPLEEIIADVFVGVK